VDVERDQFNKNSTFVTFGSSTSSCRSRWSIYFFFEFALNGDYTTVLRLFQEFSVWRFNGGTILAVLCIIIHFWQHWVQVYRRPDWKQSWTNTNWEQV
jgi:hypothetical protein